MGDFLKKEIQFWEDTKSKKTIDKIMRGVSFGFACGGTGLFLFDVFFRMESIDNTGKILYFLVVLVSLPFLYMALRKARSGTLKFMPWIPLFLLAGFFGAGFLRGYISNPSRLSFFLTGPIQTVLFIFGLFWLQLIGILMATKPKAIKKGD